VADEAAIEHAVALLEQSGALDLAPGDLSVAFVSDEAIARAHAQFMGDPTPTDVITFQGDPEMDFCGEVMVSVDTAQRACSEQGVSLSYELTLYLVHGLLHLCGHDDHDPEDLAAMRDAEKTCMDLLQKHKALPTFSIG